MKYELERLAGEAEKIILGRYGTLDGHCGEAIKLLRELALGVPINVLGFRFATEGRFFEGRIHNHVIAEIPIGEGRGAYFVDSTIRQYQGLVPGDKALPRVFGPGDFYPFRVVPGSFVREETG